MTETNTWVRRFVPRPDAQSRLFCFPYAGVGASVFRPWALRFPANIEVCAIEYPGRGTRPHEPFCTDLPLLASRAAPAITPLLDRPFFVLGYSLGALVAFEWLRILQQESGAPSPTRLLVCARGAPQVPASDSPLSWLEDSRLIASVQSRYGGIPAAILREPELLAMLLPVIRADLRTFETYHYQEGPRLTFPIHALGGDRDPNTSMESLGAWSRQTHGEFTLELFPGDHFFLNTHGDALREAILARLGS